MGHGLYGLYGFSRIKSLKGESEYPAKSAGYGGLYRGGGRGRDGLARAITWLPPLKINRLMVWGQMIGQTNHLYVPGWSDYSKRQQ